jgi:hypothetical protein
VASGDIASGDVRFANRASEPITFGSDQPLTGLVTLPGTDDIVGAYSGPIVGIAIGLNLGPREVREIRSFVGTAIADPTLGYRLPPVQIPTRSSPSWGSTRRRCVAPAESLECSGGQRPGLTTEVIS